MSDPEHRRARRRLSSLSIRLSATFALSAAVLSAAYWAVVHVPVRTELRHQEEVAAHRLFAALRSRIEAECESARSELEGLARMPAVAGLVQPAVDEAIRAAQATSVFRSFTVLGRDGIVVSQPAEPGEVGQSHAERAYFRETMGSQSFHVDGVVELPARRGLETTFCAPIRLSDGTARGVVAGHLALSGASRLSRSMAAAAGLVPHRARLLCRDGRAIADSVGELAASTLAEADCRAHPLFAIAAAGSPQVTTYVADDVAYLGLGMRLERFGWILLLEIERDPESSRVPSIVDRLALLFGAVFVGLLVAVTLYWAGIIRRIHRLTSALADYGKSGRTGGLDTGESSGEIGQAIKAFNQMVADRTAVESELIRQRGDLQILATELSRTEQRLRHKIAAELHDNISQQLAAAKIRLEMLRGRQTSADRDDSLAVAIDLLRDCIGATSDLTRELAQPILQQLGFAKAVRSLVQDFGEQNDLRLTFADDGKPKDLPGDVAEVVYRGVRELLHNVLKHAHATRAEVRLSCDRAWLRVEVADDGAGMDRGALEPRPSGVGGFGLFSIGERLRHFGGRLDVDARPEGGTRVTMQVPLETRNDPVLPSAAPAPEEQ